MRLFAAIVETMGVAWVYGECKSNPKLNFNVSILKLIPIITRLI